MTLTKKLLAFWVAMSSLALTGCETTSYYWQAVEGHFSILNKKQSIEELLASPETPDELKQKLKLVEEVKDFAETELSLPRAGSYQSFVDLGKPYVSTLVRAAPPLEVKAHQWCFLFVGCVAYRGYFDENEAQEYAQRLKREEGLDVSLGRAKAYSTLNYLNQPWIPEYFKDPLLNTFTDRSDTSIISTLIHEMAHQVVYVSGDTAFNESFAVFVEEEGTRQYLTSVGKTELFEIYLAQQADRRRFRSILEATVEQLKALYSNPELKDALKLERKEEVFAELKQTLRETEFKELNYSRWADQELNNADLIGVRTYYNYIPAFERLFRQAGNNWTAFFEEVKQRAELSKAERTKELDTLMEQAEPEI